MLTLSAILALTVISAANAATDCTATISSLSDVSGAKDCTTVNINGFTVPAGEGFTLSLATGTTVNLNGNILFGNKSWAGPLFTISRKLNGNGFIFDGGGPFYWDGLGSNGGITKPHPMMKIKISGTFENVGVVNSPAQTFSVSNPGPLVISGMNIDNSQGNSPNSQSNGMPAAHNTDGFDCSTTDLTIQKSTIQNQDDCLAINKGSNIVFTGNTCSGGHGISVGSVSSDVTVSGIVISDNTIIDNDQALRIKMDATATGSTCTGLRQFGVLIDQSYPDTLGTPGTGVILSDVNFIGSTTSLTVNSGADQVAVNCGENACTGTWDWSSLKASGGDAGEVVNFSGITGFSV
ncbi:endo-polygalacturonase PG1 [Phellopilus nigrolimitatus]|nr:endo-polygalacturonase PG1 [Phellopilus nigrolimitatus]